MKIVDRHSRDRVALEVRRFLAGETTAFAFDDAIYDIDSDDPTVRDVVLRLWCHYDDCKDHHVALSKPEWDYFQRLLLILESDRHIDTTSAKRWRPSQVVAFVTLLLFLLMVWQFGIGRYLLVLAIPFGVVSMLITYSRRSNAPTDNSFISVTPFSSFAEVRDTYRDADGFRKLRYPQELADVKIRSDTMNRILMIPTWIAWLTFSPLVLLVQAFPEREPQTKVVHNL